MKSTTTFIIQVANKYLAPFKKPDRSTAILNRRRASVGLLRKSPWMRRIRHRLPVELLIILAAIADKRDSHSDDRAEVHGRFNKGVDYVGDLAKFPEEISNDIATIGFAVGQYGPSANLKLSVHSGSDKFSTLSPIHEAMKKFDPGVHLKTAARTGWRSDRPGGSGWRRAQSGKGNL